MKDERWKMKACAKRAKAKFTWAFTASAAKVQAHEVGLKMKVRASEQESSLLELLQWAQPNFNEVKEER